MKVALPLDLPPLIPSDWDRWWKLWDQYAQPLVKTRGNQNSMAGKHVGFDIFLAEGMNPVYAAPMVDLQSLWPEFYDQVMSTPTRILVARFVMSKGDFPAHIDNVTPSWQIRAMLHHPDPDPQWYYTRLDGTDRRYMFLPQSTNWFAYLDGQCKHGTSYVEQHPKLILQIFSHPVPTTELVEGHFGRFPQYEINFD